MEFDWDERKREGNLIKHEIDFALLFAAFLDPNRITTEDIRYEYGEIRVNMLATFRERIYHITYTQRGAMTWLISARKANKREQRRYAKR